MTTNRTKILLLAAIGSLVTAIGGAAWACTAQAYISSVSPGAGSPGSRATVSASQFNPGPVEIRWNSTDGPLLTTTSGPSFSVAVTIPDVASDTYSIVAVQRQATVIVGKASVAFTVTPKTKTENGGFVSGPDGGGGGQEASGATAGDPAEESGSGRANPSGGSGPGAAASPSTAGRSAAFPAEAATGAPAQQSSGAGSPAAASTSSSPSGVSSSAASSTAAAAERRPAASPAPSNGGAGAGTATAAAAEDRRTGDALSSRSVSTDLWSGFSRGDARAASLTDTPVPNGGPSPAAVAAAVVSAALVAMLAGFGFADVRRRSPRAQAARH